MPAMNAWFFSRFFSSPGCRRIRSRQTSSVSAGSSASGPARRRSPATRPVDAGRQDVDLAHLGRVAVADLDRRVVGRHPGRPARPARGIARRARALTEAEDERRLRRQRRAGRRELEAAGQHRAEDDPVAIEARDQELARAAAGRRARCPTSASSSAGVPRTASGPGASTEVTGRPARAAWKASATTARSGNSGTVGRL